jgi:hypothetical protein
VVFTLILLSHYVDTKNGNCQDKNIQRKWTICRHICVYSDAAGARAREINPSVYVLDLRFVCKSRDSSNY